MNQDLKKLDLTKNTTDGWPRQHRDRRQPSVSSSESSSSPDRQIVGPSSWSTDQITNLEETQWRREEHFGQLKSTKQIIQSEIDIKWPMEQNQQQPRVFSESLHPEQIKYLSRDSQSELLQQLQLPPSKLSNAMRLLIQRRLQLLQTEDEHRS